MMTTKTLLTSAVAGLLAAGIAGDGAAQEKANATDKCYGVAKKGQNDCSTASHDCAGKAAKDKDLAEWKMVAKGTCEKLGGKLTAAGEAKKAPGKS